MRCAQMENAFKAAANCHTPWASPGGIHGRRFVHQRSLALFMQAVLHSAPDSQFGSSLKNHKPWIYRGEENSFFDGIIVAQQ
jgi:hypothetical protein